VRQLASANVGRLGRDVTKIRAPTFDTDLKPAGACQRREFWNFAMKREFGHFWNRRLANPASFPGLRPKACDRRSDFWNRESCFENVFQKSNDATERAPGKVKDGWPIGKGDGIVLTPKSSPSPSKGPQSRGRQEVPPPGTKKIKYPRVDSNH
jgi:hypothetical protein